MTPGAKQLLNAARHVAAKDVAILENRWHVTSAALARQSVEISVTEWLVGRGVHVDRNHRVEFLCLEALHEDAELCNELHHVWCRLSEACHAMSYEMPPTDQQLRRWFAVIDRFLNS